MLEKRLFLGTEDGVRLLRHDGAVWQVAAEGLRGKKVWAVAAQRGDPSIYLAGTYGDGLYRSEDDGMTWRSSEDGLAYGHIRAIVFDPNDAQTVHIGTEPAAMFRSDDGGHSWRELETIQHLPGASEWFLPYSPRRGAIRSIVVVPSVSGTIYGGIEQGGVILSRDGGNSWQLLGGGVHPDIHQLLLSSENPVRIYGATGGGLYRSDDSGSTWVRLIRDYIRAVWQDQLNPGRLWAAPAQRVGALGTILRSDDGGNNWHEAATGLVTPLPDMVEKFIGPVDRSLLAVTSGGRLLRGGTETLAWAEIDPLPGVHVMTGVLA
jgi:photosystem II stability/assembly factor-like uncharacterized protein